MELRFDGNLIMISAEDFIAQNTPRSALEPFHAEIAKLRAAKMSYQKIQAFLKLNGIDTHVNNVRGYCQRHIEKNTNTATKKVTKTTQKTSAKTSAAKKTSKATNATKAAKKIVSTKIARKKNVNKDIPAQKIDKKNTMRQLKKKEESIEDLQASLF